TFTYNGDHRRVKKEPPTTANTRGYVHDGENILSETDGGTTQKSAYTFEPRESAPEYVRRNMAFIYKGVL
ncbi:MAG: hypothetical protein ACKV0T_00385, partial [Planctomycetales bacterium]